MIVGSNYVRFSIIWVYTSHDRVSFILQLTTSVIVLTSKDSFADVVAVSNSFVSIK